MTLYRIAVAALLGLAPIAGASAADRAASPARTATDWSGVYVGANWGKSWGGADWSNSAGALSVPDAMGRQGNDGMFVGGTIGINRQTGAWVYGLEADLAFADIRGNVPCGTFWYTFNCRTDTKLLGSAAARLGYAVGNGLVFAKAGVAYAADQHAWDVFFWDNTGAGDAGRFGWLLGAGGEYAVTPTWSVKAEYDWYSFGSKTVSMPDVAMAINNPTTASISRDQHLFKVGVNYRLVPMTGTPAAAPVPSLFAGATAEFGTRMGWGMSRFQKDLYDPFDHGQMNSRLTYGGLGGLAGETFGRVDLAGGLFVKGVIGGSLLNGGKLVDEDFPPAAVPYSTTDSTQRGGRSLYGWGDLGYVFARGDGWKSGAFVGGQFHQQRQNAEGCVQAGSNPFICSPGIVEPGRLTITQREKWVGVRLGVAGDVMVTDRIRLSGDAAVLPWVRFTGSDTHWLRDDISMLPEEGTGWGVQLEGVASYMLGNGFSVGLGGRYTHMATTSGHTQFPFPGVPQSPETFKFDRGTVFLQATYHIGDDKPAAR